MDTRCGSFSWIIFASCDMQNIVIIFFMLARKAGWRKPNSFNHGWTQMTEDGGRSREREAGSSKK